MKGLAPAIALVLGLVAFAPSSQAVRPRVSRADLAAMEHSLNGRLSSLWPEDPYLLLGPARGVYLNGYGAVFTAEVDLAPGPGLSPFHQTMTPQNIQDNHQKLMQRLPKLREAMSDMLASTAASLDNVPSEEKVVLGVTFTQYPWQDRTNIPAQIVMEGEKGKLIAAKRAGQLRTAVIVEEF